MVSINFLSVLVAAVVAFVLGFLFHGPLLGKTWMKLANIHPTGNEKMSEMVPQMLLNLLANFVTAWALAVVYAYVSTSPLGSVGMRAGIMTGLLAWVGFLVPSSSIEVIWMGRSKRLWLFEAGCSLVVMAAMGAIIGSF